MRAWRGVLVLLLGGLAASCHSAGKPDEAPTTSLTAAEIRQTLLDSSLYRGGGEWWRSWEYASVHRPDGTMTGRVWWSDGEEIASGSWEVTEDDRYCRTWANHWGDGERGCFAVRLSGEFMVFDHASGSRGDADRYAYRVLPGNPYGL